MMFKKSSFSAFVFRLSFIVSCFAFTAHSSQGQTLGDMLLGKPQNSSIQVKRVLKPSLERHDSWTIIPGEIGSWHMRYLLTHALAHNDTSPNHTIFDIPSGNIILTQEDNTLSPSEKSEEEEGYIINFNNVGIKEYIRFISKISGKNFIFDETELDFTVTIVSEEPTSIDNIMAALLQVLRIHGMSLLEQGNNILIHKNAGIQRPSKIITDSIEDQGGEETELVTQLFHLANVSPEKLVEVIRPMVSTEAKIEVLAETNYIIVTDLATNVAKIAQVIQSLDTPQASFEIGQYMVKNTAMRSLVTLADKILTPIVQNKPFALIPHEASSSIFVVSSPFLVKRAVSVLEILDTTEETTRILSFKELGLRRPPSEVEEEDGKVVSRFTPGGIDIPAPEEEDEDSLEFLRWSEDLPADALERTYFGVQKIRYRKGDKLAIALKNMGTSLLTTGTASPELVAAINSVQWISSTNSVIFSGTKAATERVRTLIQDLDAPVRQVFIEMLILDTSIDNSLSFGVDWGVRTESPSFGLGAGFNSSTSASPLPAALNSVTLAGTTSAASLANQPGFAAGVIGKTITHGGQGFTSLGSLVKALHTDVKTNIIMNPKIITEDNTPAEIFVGTNRRFKKDSVVNNEGNIVTTNFEYRDIGTRLKVTPYLSTNDVITLEIEQEVSTTTESEGDEQAQVVLDTGVVTRKSNTKTRVHVPNNYFLIISGMMDDENTKIHSRIPCLGGLPVMGGLFKDENKTISKRNLMIFIKPHIVDTDDQIDELTKRQQEIFKRKSKFDSNKNSFKYEIDTGLEFLNVKKTCKE